MLMLAQVNELNSSHHQILGKHSTEHTKQALASVVEQQAVRTLYCIKWAENDLFQKE